MQENVKKHFGWITQSKKEKMKKTKGFFKKSEGLLQKIGISPVFNILLLCLLAFVMGLLAHVLTEPHPIPIKIFVLGALFMAGSVFYCAVVGYYKYKKEFLLNDNEKRRAKLSIGFRRFDMRVGKLMLFSGVLLFSFGVYFLIARIGDFLMSVLLIIIGINNMLLYLTKRKKAKKYEKKQG